jgi:hypothetical protein
MSTLPRLVRPSSLALAAVACAIGSGCAPKSWTLAEDCVFSGAMELSGVGDAGFGGCQAMWDKDTDTLTVQLMKGGTSGSFALPGDGWLTLRYSGASAENTTFQVGGWTTDAVPATEFHAQYTFDPATGGFGSAFGTGSMTVAANRYTPKSPGVMLEATEASMDFGNGAVLYGAFSVVAGSYLASSDTALGGGSCEDLGQSCTTNPTVAGFEAQCDEGSVSACHCAGVALSVCFIQSGCYAEAGAPTELSRADIDATCQQSSAEASALGNSCGGLTCP